MPYRTIYEGHEVICDTAEEMMALLGGSTTFRAGKKKKTDKKQPKTVRGWAKSLPREQKDLVKALVTAHPSELSDADLRAKLGAENNRKIAGLMGGLAKAAKRSEMAFTDLITKEAKRDSNGDRRYCYGVTSAAVAEIRLGLGME
jgi:hypothetical protein